MGRPKGAKNKPKPPPKELILPEQQRIELLAQLLLEVAEEQTREVTT